MTGSKCTPKRSRPTSRSSRSQLSVESGSIHCMHSSVKQAVRGCASSIMRCIVRATSS